MKKSLLALFVLLVVLSMVLSACGGASPSTTTTEPTAPPQMAPHDVKIECPAEYKVCLKLNIYGGGVVDAEGHSKVAIAYNAILNDPNVKLTDITASFNIVSDAGGTASVRGLAPQTEFLTDLKYDPQFYVKASLFYVTIPGLVCTDFMDVHKEVDCK